MTDRVDISAGYWRTGLRWQVVLRVLYRASTGGEVGPWVPIGRVWREKTAKAMVADVDDRLRRAREGAYR
jgi:hypothetical protein